MLLRLACTGCLKEFFGSLVQRRPIADVFRAQPACRFEVADGFRELLACLSRAILTEAESRNRALDAAEGAGLGPVLGQTRAPLIDRIARGSPTNT